MSVLAVLESCVGASNSAFGARWPTTEVRLEGQVFPCRRRRTQLNHTARLTPLIQAKTPTMMPAIAPPESEVLLELSSLLRSTPPVTLLPEVEFDGQLLVELATLTKFCFCVIWACQRVNLSVS